MRYVVIIGLLVISTMYFGQYASNLDDQMGNQVLSSQSMEVFPAANASARPTEVVLFTDAGIPVHLISPSEQTDSVIQVPYQKIYDSLGQEVVPKNQLVVSLFEKRELPQHRPVVLKPPKPLPVNKPLPVKEPADYKKNAEAGGIADVPSSIPVEEDIIKDAVTPETSPATQEPQSDKVAVETDKPELDVDNHSRTRLLPVFAIPTSAAIGYSLADRRTYHHVPTPISTATNISNNINTAVAAKAAVQGTDLESYDSIESHRFSAQYTNTLASTDNGVFAGTNTANGKQAVPGSLMAYSGNGSSPIQQANETTGTGSEVDSDISDLSDQVDDVEDELNDLADTVDDLSTDVMGVQDGLMTVNEQVSSVQDELGMVQGQLGDNDVSALASQLNDLEAKTYAGIASAAALVTAIPSDPGKTILNVGTGHYEGETAIGISLSRRMSKINGYFYSGIASGISETNSPLIRAGVGIEF